MAEIHPDSSRIDEHRHVDALRALAERGGIASAASLARAGISRHGLASLVASGAVMRVRRGWYATALAPRDVVAAVRAGGRLSCVSALRRLGVWTLRDDRIHVAVSPGSHPTPSPSVTLHWRAAGGVHPFPMDTPLEALEQYLHCGPAHLVVAALDSALNQRLVTRSELGAMLNGSTRGRRLAPLVDGACESGLETLAGLALRSRRVRIRRQVRIDGVGRVDLLIGDRLILELDGEQWHGGERFEEDRRRDLQLLALGYLVVRVSYKQVMESWSQVEGLLLQLIRRREHRWRARHNLGIGTATAISR